MKHLTQRELKSAGVGGSRYDAKVLGAPFPVFLVNGFETKIDPATKKTLTEIHDLPGLLAAVVKARIFHEQKLAGPDLKFIRSALCVKSGVLAKMIGVTPEHYSRCEAGTKVMSAAQEKLHTGCLSFSASAARTRVLAMAWRGSGRKRRPLKSAMKDDVEQSSQNVLRHEDRPGSLGKRQDGVCLQPLPSCARRGRRLARPRLLQPRVLPRSAFQTD